MKKFVYFLAASTSLSCVSRVTSNESDTLIVNSEKTVATAPTGLVTKSTVALFTKTSFCTGSLVKKDRILTAKHCVFDNLDASGYTVAFGVNLEKAVKIKGKGQAVINPTLDLAYFDLETSADLTQFLVAPIHFPTIKGQQSALLPGTEVVVAGFGHTAQENQTSDKIKFLRWGKLDFEQFFAEVSSTEGSTFRSLLQFAPGSNKSMICQGDSGGPVYMKINNVWGQIGVNSMSAEGCNSAAFVADARSVRDWILK